MKRKTCARMQGCKVASSERHNQRQKDLDYVRQDLTPTNPNWEATQTIAERLSAIKDLYAAATGQKLQPSAEPIKEVVLVIDDKTTMAQVKMFGELCHKAFGIEPFQWYIHRDEGHWERDKNGRLILDENGQKIWNPNYHAHIVFDAVCKEHRWVERAKKSNGINLYEVDEKGNRKPLKTMVDGYGKIIRLSREQMSQMQDLAAQATGMERGAPSDKRGLSAIEFKIERRLQEIGKAQQDLQAMQDNLDNITKQYNSTKSHNDELVKKNSQLTEEITNKESTKQNLEEVISKLEIKKKSFNTMINNLQKTIDSLNEDISNLEAQKTDTNTDITELINKINEKTKLLEDAEKKLADKEEKLKKVQKELEGLKELEDKKQKLDKTIDTLSNQITQKQKDIEAADGMITDLRNQIDFNSGLLAKLDITVNTAYVNTGLSTILSEIRQQFPAQYESLIPRDQDEFYDSLITKISYRNTEEFLGFAHVLGACLLMVDGGTIDVGGSGGGSESDLRWDGRNPGEDGEHYLDRCMQFAFSHAAIAPKLRFKGKGRGK